MATYIKTDIPDIVIIEPRIFNDQRGYFFESFNQKEFEENVGRVDFVQDNESCSTYGVLRGLHYQLPPFAQSKLVRVVKGSVLDVVVDIRRDSPTYLKTVSVELSEQNKRQVFIPRGFAHGFVVLSDEAVFMYKVDNYYSKEHERGIRFDDPALGIEWQVDANRLIVSDKDLILPGVAGAEMF